MPFTPSHAVVALAFRRTPLVPAAVAVGAMAPDVPLFVRTGVLTYAQTHDQPLISVAVAGVLVLVWWLALRPAAREISPRWLARRLPGSWDAVGARALRSVHPGRPLVAVGAIVLSLAIGVVTHVVWDAFTHADRWGVRLLPVLAEEWGPIAGFRWLQYASGVLGLAGLAIAATVWLRREEVGPSVDSRRLKGPRPDGSRRVLPTAVRVSWWMSLPTILVCAWVLGLIQHGPLTEEWTAEHLAYRVLPQACAIWAVGTLVLCLAVQVVRARREAVPNPE